MEHRTLRKSGWSFFSFSFFSENNLLPLQSEGVYTMGVSAWNPVDDWLSSTPVTVEVIERIGPIDIEDFRLVTHPVMRW